MLDRVLGVSDIQTKSKQKIILGSGKSLDLWVELTIKCSLCVCVCVCVCMFVKGNQFSLNVAVDTLDDKGLFSCLDGRSGW